MDRMYGSMVCIYIYFYKGPKKDLRLANREIKSECTESSNIFQHLRQTI